MVASIIRTVQTRALASVGNDTPVATINLDRWLYIETYLVIITASVPCIRSLSRLLLKGRSPGTARNMHELSSPYTENSRSIFRKNRTSSMDGINFGHAFDGNGSEDHILGTDYHNRTPKSRNAKQVDIAVRVESSGPT